MLKNNRCKYTSVFIITLDAMPKNRKQKKLNHAIVHQQENFELRNITCFRESLKLYFQMVFSAYEERTFHNIKS